MRCPLFCTFNESSCYINVFNFHDFNFTFLFFAAGLFAYVIKQINRGTKRSTSVDGASLSAVKLDALKQNIIKFPFLPVGQERIGLSSTPSLINGKIEPRKTIFSNFLVSNGDSYTAMTGGLSRTSSDAMNFIVSNQSGGNSKDTWIISPEPSQTIHLSKKYPERLPAAVSGILPSHTTQNLFWIGLRQKGCWAMPAFTGR